MTGRAENASQVARIFEDITKISLFNETMEMSLKVRLLKMFLRKIPELNYATSTWPFALGIRSPKNWKLEDRKHFTWSDETKVNLGPEDLKWVWKNKWEGISDRTVERTLKFGGGFLIVCGSKVWDRLGILAKIDEKIDAEHYYQVLGTINLKVWNATAKNRATLSLIKKMTRKIQAE